MVEVVALVLAVIELLTGVVIQNVLPAMSKGMPRRMAEYLPRQGTIQIVD